MLREPIAGRQVEPPPWDGRYGRRSFIYRHQTTTPDSTCPRRSTLRHSPCASRSSAAGVRGPCRRSRDESAPSHRARRDAAAVRRQGAHTRSFCREWCVVCCTHPSPQPLSQPALRGQDERPRRPPGALALARPLEASVHAAVLGVVDTHRAAGSERVAGSVAGRRSWGSGCPSAVSREIHARPPPCLGGLHSFRLFL